MLKTMEKAVFLGFIFSALISMTGFSGRCDKISGKLLRLHIIANSDSEEDQSLKLKIRDRILSSCGQEFKGINELKQAEQIAYMNIDTITKVAKDEIENNGYDYPVNVEIKNMHFNTRRYDTVTLPAGQYDALRITIGEGKGHNWWCVMFPPMCLPAAEEKQELGEVLNPSEMDIVEGESKYEIKFKILEVLGDVKNCILNIFSFIL